MKLRQWPDYDLIIVFDTSIDLIQKGGGVEQQTKDFYQLIFLQFIPKRGGRATNHIAEIH